MSPEPARFELREEVVTPWGDASRLRERMLPPGRRSSGPAGEQNQRERLFAAMVAAVAEKGYGQTTVANLIDLSGVSRSGFYAHFDDKQDCFLAAVEAVLGPAVEKAREATAQVGGEEDAREAFGSLIDSLATQPAAARMALIEVHAAGPEAVALLDRSIDASVMAACRVFEQIPGRGQMPVEMVRAILGGVLKVAQKRLLAGEGERLGELAGELWGWVMAVPPPPGRLEASRRRRVRVRKFAERQAGSTPPERVLRALAAVVAEQGYVDATVLEIVERARTSQRTFYEFFANKEEAMAAALDSGSAQMLAAALPAFRRGRDWPHSVREAQMAMLRFGCEEPEYARLGAVEMYAAGRRALGLRETFTEGMEDLLAEGNRIAPGVPAIVPEAIGGALYAMLYDFIKARGPGRLLELAPCAVYVTLAPFLGAEEAYAIAVQ